MPNLSFSTSPLTPPPPPESSSGILEHVHGFIIKEHLRSERLYCAYGIAEGEMNNSDEETGL